MKIYTRTGDDGTTGLIGGGRISKADPRLDGYGTVDELNASLGLAAAAAGGDSRLADLVDRLRQVQAELFVIGSHLATPDGSPHRASLPAMDDAMAGRLEREIDAAESELPPLRNFVLPGGTESAARLHVARTICRRAERLLVAHSSASADSTIVLTYLNRLSDWLFVQARLCNHRSGVADIPWSGKK
jgi:cob(I)alamin adenosyltransferase